MPGFPKLLDLPELYVVCGPKCPLVFNDVARAGMASVELKTIIHGTCMPTRAVMVWQAKGLTGKIK